MVLSGALAVGLALAAGGDGRLLLCRPEILGEPAQARAEVVGQAAARLGGRFLEYGAECRDAGEGVRAARRAGLERAVVSRAEATPEGPRLRLALAEADPEAGEPRIRIERTLQLSPSADALPPVRRALQDLLRALPPEPGPDPQHVAAWSVAGAGAALALVGLVLTAQASDAERQADRATDPASYARERKRARERRGLGGAALGIGGAAAAVGLTWRFAL